MSENFKKKMDFIGLNHKKELTKIFIANLVVILGAAVAIYFTKMFLYMVGTFLKNSRASSTVISRTS